MRTKLKQIVRKVEPLLPQPLRHKLSAAEGRIRVSKAATAVLGPQYKRSRTLIEIDITYACNLNCFNCNRSCEQAPTGERMTVAQIQRFVDESVAAGSRWQRIRILGGEPTLHKQFFEILDVLRGYRDRHSPGTKIEVCTNGHGEKVNAVIARIPPDVAVNNTAKVSQEQESFASFNVAPIDDPEFANADFRNGCSIMEYYGVGLGPSGYYQCTIAGGIDRIHGWDTGRRKLPTVDDSMEDLITKICRHCGHFKRRPAAELRAPLMSPTWTAAYERYRREKPRLTLYGATTSSPVAPPPADDDSSDP